jgi:hypothetical protein
LKEAAQGEGLVSFAASEALKRWEEGHLGLGPRVDVGGGHCPAVEASSRSSPNRGKPTPTSRAMRLWLQLPCPCTRQQCQRRRPPSASGSTPCEPEVPVRARPPRGRAAPWPSRHRQQQQQQHHIPAGQPHARLLVLMPSCRGDASGGSSRRAVSGSRLVRPRLAGKWARTLCPRRLKRRPGMQGSCTRTASIDAVVWAFYTDTMWALKNQTPYAAERNWTRDKHGVHWWLVAVKATFDIAPGGRLELADEQPASSARPRIPWRARQVELAPRLGAPRGEAEHGHPGPRACPCARRETGSDGARRTPG